MTTPILGVPDLEKGWGVEPARAVEQRVRAGWAALDSHVPHLVLTHGEVIRVLMGSGPGVVCNAALVCRQRRSTGQWAPTPRT